MMLLFGLLVFGIALTTAIPIDGEFKTLMICPKILDLKSSQIQLKFVFDKSSRYYSDLRDDLL